MSRQDDIAEKAVRKSTLKSLKKKKRSRLKQLKIDYENAVQRPRANRLPPDRRGKEISLLVRHPKILLRGGERMDAACGMVSQPKHIA